MSAKITTYNLEQRGRPLRLHRESGDLCLDTLAMAGLPQCNELLTKAHVMRSRKDALCEFFKTNCGRLLYTLAEQGHEEAISTLLSVLRALAEAGTDHSLRRELQQCRDYEFSHWRCGPLAAAAMCGHARVIELLFNEFRALDPSLTLTKQELIAGTPAADPFRSYHPNVAKHYALIVAAEQGNYAAVDCLLEEYLAVDPSGDLTKDALRPYQIIQESSHWRSEHHVSSVLSDAVRSVRWFRHKEEGLTMVRLILDECWHVDPTGALSKELLTYSIFGVPDVINRASILDEKDGGCHLMQVLLHDYERVDPSGELLLQALRARQYQVLFHIFQSRSLRTLSLLLDCYMRYGQAGEVITTLETFTASADNLVVDEFFVGKEMNQLRFHQDQRYGETIAEYEQRRDSMFLKRLTQLLSSMREDLTNQEQEKTKDQGGLSYE